MDLAALILQEAAPAADAAAQSGPPFLLGTVLPLVAVFVIFYFVLIKPQQKQKKERESLLTQVKKNDHVLTSGGLIGIVDKVKDDEVILKLDDRSDVRLRVRRAAIVDILKVSGAAEDQTKPANREN